MIPVQCKGCNKIFKCYPSHAVFRVFCTRECQGEYYRELKKCPSCLLIFKSRVNMKRNFCSRECSNRASAKKKKFGAERLSCKCRTCGTTFDRLRCQIYVNVHGVSHTYCSKECRFIGHRSRRNIYNEEM